MSPGDSVTQWIGQLRTGDDNAAARLFDRYFGWLVGLARKQLQGTPRRWADEDDVALSAFHSLCEGAQRPGHFDQLSDRASLRSLLARITRRKAIDLIQHDLRLTRGGGKVVCESALPRPADPAETVGMDQLPGAAPPPDLVAQVNDELQRLLTLLQEPELQRIAVLKLEGYQNEEIAVQLGIALRSVERKVKRIRSLWKREDRP
jgi:DNA-directed RNA polymerase specialized sigma24 family protein